MRTPLAIARLQFLEAGILAPDPLAGGEADARRRPSRSPRSGPAGTPDCSGRRRRASPRSRRARRARRCAPPPIDRTNSAWRSCRRLTVLLHQRRQPLGGRIGRAVIDVDDFVGPAAVERAAISAISGATLSASLRTGTTMETATASVSEGGKSALVWLVWEDPEPGYRAAWRRPLLWGGSAPGNPFEAPGRGPDKGHNAAVALDRKAEPAGRKPVAHEHRADDADQRARRRRRSDDGPAAPAGSPQ